MPRRCRLLLLACLFALSPGLVADASILQPTNWNRLGGQAGARFGTAVAPAGDVDGDGYSDVIIGAPLHDTGVADGGRAVVYRGGAAGLAATPVWTFSGAQVAEQVGGAVASAGDLNGDGYADVLVGAPFHDGPLGVDQGQVLVFYGSAGGLALAASQTLDGPSAGAQFGFAVASAGDADADGYDDVLVGAPAHTGTFGSEGMVRYYRGGPGGLTGPTWFKLGGAANARLGHAVSGAGDVNADGFADLVLGAPGGLGQMTHYRGSAGGPLAAPTSTITGASDSVQYGWSVSLAGDMNGDGYADVLVGEPHRNEGLGLDRTGHVYLYQGKSTGLGPQRLWESTGSVAYEHFGQSVATAGDLNGDGYADFVVSGERWPAPASGNGRAVVYLGSPGGATLDSILTGTVPAQTLGFVVGTAGDIDGDGFGDLFVGEPGATGTLAAEGRVTFYRGSASKPRLAEGWPKGLVADVLGTAMAGGLDPAATGANDLYLGSAGEQVVYQNEGSMREVSSAFPTPVYSGEILWSGGSFEARLPSALTRAGDANGDGYEDLLVGSATYPLAQQFFAGRAQIHYGGAAGLATTAGWTTLGSDVVREGPGRSVAAGDFNADGYSDVVVGLRRADQVLDVLDGGVKLYYGAPGGPSTEPAWRVAGLSGSWLGEQVVTGDWDGDGYDDLAISATPFQEPDGTVRVHFGGAAGLDTIPGWVLTELNYGEFGIALASAGDVDGDGVGDLVAGARDSVYLIRGSQARSIPTFTAPGSILRADVTGQIFGRDVAGIGDIDKDGYADILVSTRLYDNGQTNEGRVTIHRGGPGGLNPIPWSAFESNAAGLSVGYSPVGVADINHDGWPDFAHSSSGIAPGGTAYVWLGGAPSVERRLTHGLFGGLASLPIGARVQNPGDFFIRHTFHAAGGRLKARAEMQIAPVGMRWSQGERVLFGPFDTDGSPDIANSYSAITPQNSYRYRTRTITRSPYFPTTPWMQPRGFDTASTHFRVGGVALDAGAPASLRAGIRLTGIEPSPFRDRARLRFRLPRAGSGSLALYDVSGRRVRALVEGAFAAGEHEAVFDGRDADGQAVAAGVYFAVLSLGGERDVRKLVRLP